MENREFSEQELKRVWSFLVETFELTEEQLAAVDHQVPMSQELFDSILDKCEEVGSDMDRLFFCMQKEFPEFLNGRADRIAIEVEDVDLPPVSEEVSERIRQNIYA